MKGKIGETNFTEKSWDNIVGAAAAIAPEDESAYGKFIDAQASYLKTLDGQVNHIIATETSKNKTSYEGKIAELNKELEKVKGKPSVPDKGKGEEDETKKHIEELSAKIQAMEEKEVAAQNEKSVSEKKKSFLKELKEKGCDNDEILEIVELKTKIDKDSNIEDLVSEGKKIYDTKYKKLFGNKYSPSGGGNGNGSGKPTKEAESIKEKNKNRIKNFKL